jgi:hypothetical protein
MRLAFRRSLRYAHALAFSSLALAPSLTSSMRLRTDDGGVGADYGACEFGTDCADCGARVVYDPPPPPGLPPSPNSPPPPPPLAYDLCTNDCTGVVDDGQCDDGGSGSDFNVCNFGARTSHTRYFKPTARDRLTDSSPLLDAQGTIVTTVGHALRFPPLHQRSVCEVWSSRANSVRHRMSSNRFYKRLQRTRRLSITLSE